MNFADEVDHIAPPQTADAAGIAQFQKNLKAISDPLRKKAITTWQGAYQKALQNGVGEFQANKMRTRHGVRFRTTTAVIPTWCLAPVSCCAAA